MSVSEQIKSFTASKIHKMLSNPSDSAARASMARLRRGIGSKPGALPEIWGEFLLDMPEELMGNGEPSRAEWAIYVSLTLFALHQQSSDRKAEPMNRAGVSLGEAANQLVENEDDRERIARRFYPVAVSTNMSALSQHLRSLISLLRAKHIPLDYVQLSSDLFYLQNPKTADGIRLRWGQDFCRIHTDDIDNEKEG